MHAFPVCTTKMVAMPKQRKSAPREQRYVLLEVTPDAETDRFQDDSYEDAMSELDILHMLAHKLGYTLTKKEKKDA